MRYLISGGLIAMFASSAIAATVHEAVPVKASVVESKSHLDKMITGIDVSTAVHAEWLRNSKRLETCGRCATTQPFPGDDLD